MLKAANFFKVKYILILIIISHICACMECANTIEFLEKIVAIMERSLTNILE